MLFAKLQYLLVLLNFCIYIETQNLINHLPIGKKCIVEHAVHRKRSFVRGDPHPLFNLNEKKKIIVTFKLKINFTHFLCLQFDQENILFHKHFQVMKLPSSDFTQN